MIKVWGRASSSNVQAVIWCLQELGVEYQRIDAGFTYGLSDTPEYLAMNPNGLVPTLKDADNPPLFESCAIMRYLSSRYATDDFWPENVVERASVDMWAEWSKLNVAVLFTGPIFWPKVRLAPSVTDPQVVAKACDTLHRNLKIADQRLADSSWLACDQLTMADIVFGHVLFRYYDIDIPRPEFENIARYYQRLKERPAYREAVMLSYDELRYRRPSR